MAEDNQNAQVAKPNLSELMKNPLVQEFAIPMLKMTIKKELGIGTSEKAVTQKPFGRAAYALRDFIQGTWWVLVALYFSYYLMRFLFAVLQKWAGVQI